MTSGLMNLLRGELPSYTRKARHFDMLVRYADARKLANVARAEVSRLRQDIVVKAKPYIYTVDVGNLCNLRCPLCPTGYRGLERPQAIMSLSEFEAIFAKIRPYALEVILHNWGEPFLNPNILEIVNHASKNGVGTTISSNLNLVNRDETFLEQVVDSGLDHLTVSLDGTTQEVYETYRRGGNMEHVLHNVRHLLDYRRKQKRRSPQVEWQFLVMKHNQQQMEAARRMAAEIGVDRLRFTGAGLPFNELSNVSMAKQWISDLAEYRGYAPEKMLRQGYLYDEPCFYLYRAMTINPHGEVAPCCALYHSKYDFGNLLEGDLDEVWNNEHYQSSRALFSRKPYHGKLKTACHRCPLFKYESSRHSLGATAAL